MQRSLAVLFGSIVFCVAASCGTNDVTNGSDAGSSSSGSPDGASSSGGDGTSSGTTMGDAYSSGSSGGSGSGSGSGGSGGIPEGGGSGGQPDVNIPVPPNHRVDFNLNIGWKFIKQDVPGAEAPMFNDQSWADVSTPHTYNETDTYVHLGPGMVDGEIGQYTGIAWYRKHFTVPMNLVDRKVFVEFQGVRQRGTVYINGTKVGMNETGFVPFGFDLTPNIKFGQDNVIAVQCDNTFPMNVLGSTNNIAWHNPHWHPNFGGITSDVYLHVTDKLYVTLPLVMDLKTSGIYVHADNVTNAAAPVTVEAQIRNEYPAGKSVQITAKIVDAAGKDALVLNDMQTVAPMQSVVSKTTGMLANPSLWSPANPYLYTVQVIVTDGGQVVDVSTAPLGVRYFKFSPTTGLAVNGQPLKLHGWGQKPTNSWAGLGAAVPDWMHEYSMRMMKQGNGNFVRWGHCAGSAANIRLSDKYGIITLQPGTDAEAATGGGIVDGTTTGAAWTLRTQAFGAIITYFRNNPSIFIWEGGNKASATSAADIQTMRTIKDMLDPTRVFTMRVVTDPTTLHFFDVLESTIGAEYATGSMLGVFEGEYNRFESPRRVWDPLTPPHTGWTNPAAGSQNWAVAQDSEQSSVEQAIEWNGFATKAGHSGGANWHFSDEPTHRRVFTDVSRDSGEVDAVRLPKDSYYALQAMWSDTPQVHIVGHWTYPAGTNKTVYVISNTDSVQLSVNGTSLGMKTPTNGYLFTFPAVAWQSGTIKAVGTKGGVQVTDQKSTAGAADHIKLTATTATGGWSADGVDIAIIDVEVVDAMGNRVPADEGRIDFTITGPAIWRGGYNSGLPNTTNNKNLNTEGGINRVFVRSTTMPGAVTVTATRTGIMPGMVTVTSVPVNVTGGLTTTMPATL
jgi:beta-galactosidase